MTDLAPLRAELDAVERRARVCVLCGEMKDATHFSLYYDKGGRGKYRRRSYCRPCDVIRQREYANTLRGRKAKIRKDRKYHKRHVQSIREAKRERYRKDRDRFAERDKRTAQTAKGRARRTLRQAVRSRKVIKPAECERCGERTPKHLLSGHHHDYSKPLLVEWLCRWCHAREHAHAPRLTALMEENET